ncbi:Crossover junction endonuclease EME1B [Vitis vinifera]|uniref:Crossover junction endonuclease EME1B n=1 Tax=Vitis vinifera TaxID=29760 RepID=A0A438KJS8_VITVI|nr:Crossover junction endonuclease EME1B [Vitis vinifera]
MNSISLELHHLVDLNQYRKKLTRLSVNANGSLIPKDSTDRNLIKKSVWLKALVAIPKVQPRFAIAIWKKYPTMKSLLRVYMDPSKSISLELVMGLLWKRENKAKESNFENGYFPHLIRVHEKEFLLKDLTTEGLLGEDRRLGEVCSKRVYRILMAQSGNMKTDDVEDGADFFRHQSS